MSFNRSENIEKIAIALSKFQGEVTDPVKDQVGYGYKYASLESIFAIARPLCAKHELAISQLCSADDKMVVVNTVLMHSSGQWIGSEFRMSLTSAKTGNAIQTAGSIITYIRRYSLSAMLGMTTQSDNDGAYDKVEESKPVAKPISGTQSAGHFLKITNSLPIKGEIMYEDETMYQKVVRIIKARKMSAESVTACLKHYNVFKLSELSEEQLNDFLFKYLKV